MKAKGFELAAEALTKAFLSLLTDSWQRIEELAADKLSALMFRESLVREGAAMKMLNLGSAAFEALKLTVYRLPGTQQRRYRVRDIQQLIDNAKTK